MNTKGRTLTLGALGVAAAQAVMFTGTAQGQITTCDNPNYCECFLQSTICGSVSENEFLWCDVLVCTWTCC